MFTPGTATTITGKRVIIDGIDTTLTPTSGNVMFTIGAQSNVTLERVAITGGPDAAVVVQTGTARLYAVTFVRAKAKVRYGAETEPSLPSPPKVET